MNTLKMKSLLTVFALLPLGLSVASCSEDSENTVVNPSPENPGGDNKLPGTVLSPLQQKEKLDDIACDFLEQLPASDFQNFKSDLEDLELGNYLYDYDWENVQDWARNCFEGCSEALGTTTTKREEYYWWGATNYIYTNYKAILLPSNFTGKFTAKNGKWTRADASYLEFEIPEKNVVLSLSTAGNVKKVYAFNLDDWQDYEYDYNKGEYNEYYDRTQCTIGVPEMITVTLKVNNEVLVNTTISINLSDITDDQFDIAKSGITVSATTLLNNGYKFNFSELKYVGNNNVAAKMDISKNNKMLISAMLSSNIEHLPSCNFGKIENDESIDSDDFEKTNGKNAYAKVDILGRLQLEGKIEDIRKFAKYLESANDNDENETNYKSYINQANSLINANIYFDNTSTKQAVVKLEPFQESNWYATYWECEPVIYFEDGSSYSTFEAFFDADDFGNTIETFEDLIDKYQKMLED